MANIPAKSSEPIVRFGRSGYEDDMSPGTAGWGYYRPQQYPFVDHTKSVVQLQKRAFLDEAPFAELLPREMVHSGAPYSDAMQPYAMGFDKETYNRVVLLPSTFMGVVIALLLCTMFTRYKQGKPITPFSRCPPGAKDYEAVGELASTHEGSVARGPPEEAVQPPGSDYGRAPSAAAAPPPPPSAAPAPPPSAAPAPPSAAPAAAKKEPLPYERIPTPGVTPYLWSPPATIFQPSPTPPGTPFVGSPHGGGGAESSDPSGADADGYFRRLRKTGLM